MICVMLSTALNAENLSLKYSGPPNGADKMYVGTVEDSISVSTEYVFSHCNYDFVGIEFPCVSRYDVGCFTLNKYVTPYVAQMIANVYFEKSESPVVPKEYARHLNGKFTSYYCYESKFNETLLRRC